MQLYSCHHIVTKMLRVIIFVLSALIIKVYSADPDFSYCTCMKDVATAKANYDKIHDDYFDNVFKPKQAELIKEIEPQVATMNGGKCDYPYFKNQTAYDYTYDMLTMCGGTALRTRFDNIWSDKELKDEEVCGYIAAQGPMMIVYIGINVPYLKGGCDFKEKFDKNIFGSWEECHKQKC